MSTTTPPIDLSGYMTMKREALADLVAQHNRDARLRLVFSTGNTVYTELLMMFESIAGSEAASTRKSTTIEMLCKDFMLAFEAAAQGRAVLFYESTGAAAPEPFFMAVEKGAVEPAPPFRFIRLG